MLDAKQKVNESLPLCFVFFQYKYQTSFNQDMFISDANVNEVLKNVIKLNEFILKTIITIC